MKFFYAFLTVFLLISGCKTIENKSQDLIQKENEKLGKFLQKSEAELKIKMGIPDNVILNNEGAKFFVYTKKKYNITCERKFEINKNKIVVGFTSTGCF
jgi:hypothetical protein